MTQPKPKSEVTATGLVAFVAGLGIGLYFDDLDPKGDGDPRAPIPVAVEEPQAVTFSAGEPDSPVTIKEN